MRSLRMRWSNPERYLKRKEVGLHRLVWSFDPDKRREQIAFRQQFAANINRRFGANFDGQIFHNRRQQSDRRNSRT